MKRRQLFLVYVMAISFFLSTSDVYSKNYSFDEKNNPQIISAPTIPYPEGTPPADFSDQFDIREYEQNELNLNEVLASCGDQYVDEFEECDDGNRELGDGCSDLCTLEAEFLLCGDGRVDPGETCDDGNNSSGDGCSESCQYEFVCGDGKQENGEACDDGNTKSGDGCSAKCIKENVVDGPTPICGNGIKESGEGCDDGNTESGDGCSSRCVAEKVEDSFCGDGKVSSEEECDDGNRDNGDGCSSICVKEKIIDDYPFPQCKIDPSKTTTEYKKGQAKTSIPSCKGACTMKVLTDNCGNIIGSPTWVRSESKVSPGSYIGRGGAEYSCQTGQVSQDRAIIELDIFNVAHQAATVIDCELA